LFDCLIGCLIDIIGTVDSNTKSESVENNCQTLWVGNVDPAFVTEGTLIDIFSQCGTVEAVHVLTDRYCAFVKLGSSQEASLALSKLQVHLRNNCPYMVLWH
jgi:RNA recognition motif-containing protein